MSHEESRIQRACIKWFRLQYRHLKLLLFSVPNGGQRSKIEAAIMVGEGLVAGVADLLLWYPSLGYHGLAIEIKTPKGKQSPRQIEWQQAVEKYGYKYIVCRSLDDFIREVKAYIGK